MRRGVIRFGRRERGMSSLQAVLLCGAAFLVVWGLMTAWEEASGGAGESFATTSRGEIGKNTATGRPAGGGGSSGESDTDTGGADTTSGNGGERDEGEVTTALDFQTILDAAVDGATAQQAAQIKKILEAGGPESLAKNLKLLEKVKATYAAGKFLKEAIPAVQNGDDRAILVAMFEGLGGVAVDKVLDKVGLSGPLASITGGWTGSTIGKAFGEVLADGINAGSRELVAIFDDLYPGVRADLIEWRKGLR